MLVQLKGLRIYFLDTLCKMLWALGLTLAVLITGTRCLRNVKLEISPDAVQLGESTILKCHYELEDTPLYSLKWYRGSVEFYRYSPGEKSRIKIFNSTSIDVDPTRSDESQVALRNVRFEASANYSCEVTTDAPLFSTASSSHYLNVVSIPRTKPVIKTEQERYAVGDTLRANCSVPASKPQAKISFTINGYKTDMKQSGSDRREHNSVMQHRSGESNDRQHHQRDLSVPRQRQLAKLNLELKEHHFAGGQLNLRCSVNYPGVYDTWNEIQLGSQSIKDPVPARAYTTSNSIDYHRIANPTILGLILLHLHFR